MLELIGAPAVIWRQGNCAALAPSSLRPCIHYSFAKVLSICSFSEWLLFVGYCFGNYSVMLLLE